MKFIHLPSSSRTGALIELSRTLRGCRGPYEGLLIYCRYLREAYPERGHIVLSTEGLAKGEYRVWRLLGDDGVERIEPRDPWEKLDLPVYRGGVLGRIVEMAAPHLVREIDWSEDADFRGVLGAYQSMLAVPLFNAGLPLNWSLGLSRDANSFTPGHLEESVTRATLIGSLLGSLHVSRELVNANAHIDAELERMARIQRALLPEPIPQIPGVQLAASYETFGQVGGDLYDFLPLKEDASRWCIFLGDASGHGPSAAVVAAMVQATLHDCAVDSAGPAELFGALNQRLCRKRIEGSFVTALLGFYEPSARRLCYASAGHPAPLHLSSGGGRTRYLDMAGGLPLGIEETAVFDEKTIELAPRETLLLYTDGITEARSSRRDMFGEEGLERALAGYGGGAQGMIDQLRKTLTAHQQGTRPNDDQTMVALQVE
jgi:sigma-B regulation protein RsbU (phosphoserine phosphatase)